MCNCTRFQPNSFSKWANAVRIFSTQEPITAKLIIFSSSNLFTTVLFFGFYCFGTSKVRNLFSNSIIVVVKAFKGILVYCFIVLDENECQNSPNLCASPSTCENIGGSYYCKCPSGYNKKSGTKDQCEGRTSLFLITRDQCRKCN